MTHERRCVLLVGYWPLLRPEDVGIIPGIAVGDCQRVLEYLSENYTEAHGVACLWTKSSPTGPTSPVLVMPRARQIADHLKTWAEGKPEEWFQFAIKHEGDKYAIVLAQDPGRSIRRYKLARLVNDETVGEDDKFIVISQPIQFMARNSAVFGLVRDALPLDRVDIGLLDVDDLKGGNPDNSTIIHLGCFRRDDAGLAKYLDAALADD